MPAIQTGLLDRCGGGMNQLVGQRARQARHHLCGRLAAVESAQGPVELALAQALSHAAIGFHIVDNGQRARLLEIQTHTFLDDDICLARLAVAAAQVFVDDLAQVIDAVKIDIAEFADLRFDVARHGNIHH